MADPVASSEEMIESISSPGVEQDSLREINAKIPTEEELSTVELKMATARSKKDIGDAAFKTGDIKAALRSYHETLMFLIGIDKNALKSLGMSMPSSQSSTSAVDQSCWCKGGANRGRHHYLRRCTQTCPPAISKQENWKRAVETADKALSKNPANSKALFRKAKALGELGFFEKAEVVLNEVKKVSPSEAPMADAEIVRQKAMDRERQKVHDQKLRGFLSRGK